MWKSELETGEMGRGNLQLWELKMVRTGMGARMLDGISWGPKHLHEYSVQVHRN